MTRVRQSGSETSPSVWLCFMDAPPTLPPRAHSAALSLTNHNPISLFAPIVSIIIIDLMTIWLPLLAPLHAGLNPRRL